MMTHIFRLLLGCTILIGAFAPQPSPTTPTPTPQATPARGGGLTVEVANGTALEHFLPGEAFILHFNQPMDPRSTAQALLPYPYVAGKLDWDSTKTILTFTPEKGFIPGKSYTFFLGTALKSQAGESFSQAQSWVIQIVDAPQVIERSPGKENLQERRPEIQLRFDRPMDPGSLPRSLTIQPAVPFWMDGKDDKWTIRLEQALTPGVRYNFTLAKTSADRDGILPGEDYRWEYWLAPFSISLQPSMEYAVDQLEISLRFNYGIDTEKTGLPFRIEPTEPGEWQWHGKNLVSFTARQELAISHLYRVVVIGPIYDQNGDELPLANLPVTFGAQSPILSTDFVNGRESDADASIRVNFNQPMDPVSTEKAFRIYPPLKGHFTWEENRLSFVPQEAWKPFTEYTLSIETSALNATNQPVLVVPYTWSMSTSGSNNEGQALTFGSYGANIQVVDADGRRAVQFGLNQKGPARVRFDLVQFDLGSFVNFYTQYFQVRYYGNPASMDTSGLEIFKTWQTAYDSGGVQELIIPAEVPPGLYVLDMSAQGKVYDQIFLALTRNTLVVKRSGDEILAWVSDINGGSLADVEVRLYSQRGEKLRVGKTEEGGLFRTTIPSGYEPMLVAARGEGEDVTIAGLGSGWYSSNSWCCDWGPGGEQNTPKYLVYMYTDRPIYKPGQTVYFKTVLRNDNDVKYSLPPQGTPLTIHIRDARDNIVQTLELSTNNNGTINGEFHLADGAMLGDYELEALISGEKHTQVFKVQDYRKPDFQVSVKTSSEGYVRGDSVEVSIDVSYFYGKPVSNAKLTVKKYRLSEIYTGWWEGTGSDQVQYVWFDTGETLPQTVDPEGHASLSLEAALAEYDLVADWDSSLTHSTWGIEVTADDGSGQLVSSAAIYKVYNAAEKINMDLGGYLKRPGNPFTIQASMQTLSGKGVGDRSLTLELRQWDRQNWDYTQVVTSTSITTGLDGKASLSFTPTAPGYYQVRLSGSDSHANPISFNRWIYVYGSSDTWANPFSQEVRISADRDSYQPYQKARFIIESSFSGPALLTFERGRVNRALPVMLTAPITIFDTDIIPEDAPNIFVTINAWQTQDTRLAGRGDEFDYTTSLSDSRLRASSVELRVEPLEKALNVTLKSDRQAYSPRQEATFTIAVSDQKGQPVSAEVSLTLVDESIYSLSGDLSLPIFQAFYGRRSHTVWTFDSMAPIREIIAGGRGGGGGGDTQASPRSDFPDTAAWFPALQTDENGRVSVTVTLPDNLTGWRLTARAVTPSSQVGEAHLNFLTQQEIVLRPILPGSLTEGDQIEISAMVHNYASAPRQVMLTLAGDLLNLNLPPTQTVQLQPGEMQIVSWPVSVIEAGEGYVTLTAITLQGEGDAVRLPLSVQPLAVQDVYTQAGDFSGEWSTILSVPEPALPASSIQVQLSRSPAGSVLQGLDYLTGYPYGCVEQTMSRALPNAVVGRAISKLGIQQPALQDSLPDLVRAGLQRLYGYQHEDGGWGWWFDDQTDDYQTAWVIFGLTVTADAGYEVDPQVIERGAAYLTARLDQMDLRTRAYALYSLATAGHGDLPAAQAMLERLYELDPFSQAALALALKTLGAEEQAHSILDILAQSALVEGREFVRVSWPGAQEDGNYYDKTMASTLRNTALILDAFSRIQPDHPLIPGIVRFLMNGRRAYGWGSTNETAYTILALTDHLLAVNSFTPETAFSVMINDQEILTGTLGLQEMAASLEIPVSKLQPGTNLLRIRSQGEGQVYYVVNSRMLLPQAQIEASGLLEVTRAYLDAKTGKPLQSMAAGQLVKVQLTVKLPRSGSFLILEDRLPGGLEALNERLNTTSHDGAAFDYEFGGPRFYWEDFGYNNKEIHGDRVSFFITELEPGTYTVTYLARATHAGTFTVLPAEAYAMYDPGLWGRSSSLVIDIIH